MTYILPIPQADEHKQFSPLYQNFNLREVCLCVLRQTSALLKRVCKGYHRCRHQDDDQCGQMPTGGLVEIAKKSETLFGLLWIGNT